MLVGFKDLKAELIDTPVEKNNIVNCIVEDCESIMWLWTFLAVPRKVSSCIAEVTIIKAIIACECEMNKEHGCYKETARYAHA